MAVECPEGLVGTVQIVDSSRCQVQLLSSAGLTIGALDKDRNPPPEGLLSGESTSKLRLIFLDPEVPVTVGDHIVTSGHSEHIPKDILIGKVIAVDFNPEFGTRRATVFPAVQVGNLREVSVLK
jgi:rod shape-determining protein MreC